CSARPESRPADWRSFDRPRPLGPRGLIAPIGVTYSRGIRLRNDLRDERSPVGEQAAVAALARARQLLTADVLVGHPDVAAGIDDGRRVVAPSSAAIVEHRIAGETIVRKHAVRRNLH